jgi:hypothetical protein
LDRAAKVLFITEFGRTPCRVGRLGAWGFPMSLKNAAVFALIGMTILTIFLGIDFILAVINVIRGLIPAIRLLTSFVHLLASVGVTVFLNVFQRAQH